MFHQTPNSGHPTTSIRTTHEVSRGVNNSCIFPTYPLFSPRLHTVALSMARLEDVSPGSSIVPAHVILQIVFSFGQLHPASPCRHVQQHSPDTTAVPMEASLHSWGCYHYRTERVAWGLELSTKKEMLLSKLICWTKINDSIPSSQMVLVGVSWIFHFIYFNIHWPWPFISNIWTRLNHCIQPWRIGNLKLLSTWNMD